MLAMGVRERFISSIGYLRNLGFFEEYSNLTSEEIFEKISEDDIFLRDLDKKEYWRKESDFDIDRYVIIKDKKRIWEGFDYDELPNPGVGLDYLNGLASISRGVFQPTNVREEYKLDKDRETGLDVGYCRVYFTYRGKDMMLEFSWNEVHRWQFGHAMNELNWMIQHTGYRYYRIRHPDMSLFIVLKPEEAKKLRKERGWKLEGIW